METRIEAHEVFGIAPNVSEYSYVDRGNLDSSLRTMLDRPTHVAISGPSKSGKSWLRKKVLNEPIVVQCRLRKPYTGIYVDALSQLGISVRVKECNQGVFRASVSASGKLGAGLLAKVGLEATLDGSLSSEEELRTIGHDVNDLRFIADIIRSSGRRLVIEDFHYMSVEDRTNFAFDLKALWDYGVFVIVIGVWSQTNLLLYLNPDLTGRVSEISVDWTADELGRILTKGSKALGISFRSSVRDRLVSLAYSNAGLLQKLTLLTLDEAKKVKGSGYKIVDDVKWVDDASMSYADELNSLYQQFAKRVASGIRTRKNATGIYAHTMAVIMNSSEDELIGGLHARTIFERAVTRQSRILYGNLKAVLGKINELQVDEDGRGIVLEYNEATEEVTIVDRQLLLYRRYATVTWPWEGLIAEAETYEGRAEAEE